MRRFVCQHRRVVPQNQKQSGLTRRIPAAGNGPVAPAVAHSVPVLMRLRTPVGPASLSSHPEAGLPVRNLLPGRNYLAAKHSNAARALLERHPSVPRSRLDVTGVECWRSTPSTANGFRTLSLSRLQSDDTKVGSINDR
jgi:hypothetical protein